MSPTAKPDPGSDAAIAKGCSCPVLDNAHGKGRYGDGKSNGWWINSECVLHGPVTPDRNAKENP